MSGRFRGSWFDKRDCKLLLVADGRMLVLLAGCCCHEPPRWHPGEEMAARCS
jgi:hypothetical protein